MYPAFLWRFVLLALMRYAACLSFETPRSSKTDSANRFQARRCDCSFILLFQCRPWWENFMLALLTAAIAIRNSAVILSHR